MEINITQIVITIVGLVFSAVIVPLTRAAFEWLKGKTKNEALKTALEEAKVVADNVVASLQANVVDSLKEKSADGKLSAQEVDEISDAAMEMFLNDISARTLALLEENADDISAYIGNLIESRLAQLKKG